MIVKYPFLIIVLLIFLSNHSFSQNTSEFSGRVLDNSNQQPLAGVSVTLLNDDEVVSGAETDDNGFFLIKNLDAGFYQARFSLLGYETFLLNDVVLRSGIPTDVLIEMKEYTTDEIVVEEILRRPSDISNSFKSLTNEEVRRSPGGFEDIGRVLQTLPGVSFVNDGRNDLLVRGGSPTENLFIVDNSIIPNINHFGSQGATGGPVSLINLDFIREVDFITGGFPAKYGDKLSAVLDVKLREGNRSKFLGDINLSATGFGAVFEGPIGNEKKGSWLVSARRSYLDLIFNAAGFGFVPEYSSIQGKFVYEFGDKNTLTINALGNLDKVKFNNDDEENRQDNEQILKNNQTGYSNSYQLKTLLSDKSYSIVNISRNFVKFDYSARDSLFTERFKNLSEEGETTIKAEYYYTPSNKTIVETGGAFRLVSFKNEIYQREDTLLITDPETGEPFVLPELNINADN
ncbi:MAG TPA: TonB-dependent receptor, partial [Ignavibacteria bacterium]|nr:TonB-dependent receptor [Ignavibacteria bacterium]